MENLDNVSLNKISLTSKQQFINEWSGAKSVLLILRDSIKNPIVKGVINVVISSGDLFYQVLSKK